MVLVGHSMGGLIANMQIVNSRDDFWHIVSDNPIPLSQSRRENTTALDRTFYFQANPSVRRIITIGTPHRGSYFANDVTRYLARQADLLPRNDDRPARDASPAKSWLLSRHRMLDTATSIDSLSPDAPMLPVLLAAQRPPWIKYDNIVGRLPQRRLASSPVRRR